MHIPDNYLSPATCAVMGAVMVPVWAAAVRKVRQEVSRESLPLLGIGAAFSFLIMMFNVPLPGGTTGHAVGGTLLAVLLGPWAACISVTVALLLQALMFGDGGILSFGANAFNMAFVIPFLGSFLFRAIRGWSKSPRGEQLGLAVGSSLSLTMAALCAAVELGIQPVLFRDAAGLPLYFPYPLSISIPAMVLPNMAVASVADAIFSVAVFTFIRKVSPDAISQGSGPPIRGVHAGLVALVSLTPLGLLASGSAWGEWDVGAIARAVGYVPKGMKTGIGLPTLFPAYRIQGVAVLLGYVISAIAGTAVLVIVFKLVGLALKQNGKSAQAHRSRNP